jgi:chromosome segregation ATPase
MCLGGQLSDEVRMSRLDLAQNRFQAALEALENTVATVGENLDAAAKLPERIAELEAEREKLLARVAELEEEVSVLSGLTEEVEGRLDGAIGEIRTALAR